MQMNPQGAQNYLRTRVFTATPEQLQMMLYDGAIRFAEQARPALEQKDWETSYIMLSKAQKIVTELNLSMKREVYPELCARLASLYNYVYRKLIEASVEHSVASLDEGLRILRFQRETWQLLMAELSKQKAPAPTRAPVVSAASPRPKPSLSVSG